MLPCTRVQWALYFSPFSQRCLQRQAAKSALYCKLYFVVREHISFDDELSSECCCCVFKAVHNSYSYVIIQHTVSGHHVVIEHVILTALKICSSCCFWLSIWALNQIWSHSCIRALDRSENIAGWLGLQDVWRYHFLRNKSKFIGEQWCYQNLSPIYIFDHFCNTCGFNAGRLHCSLFGFKLGRKLAQYTTCKVLSAFQTYQVIIWNFQKYFQGRFSANS